MQKEKHRDLMMFEPGFCFSMSKLRAVWRGAVKRGNSEICN